MAGLFGNPVCLQWFDTGLKNQINAILDQTADTGYLEISYLSLI